MKFQKSFPSFFGETNEKAGGELQIKFCLSIWFPTNTQKRNLFFWIDIQRDWRGSNPQLPPWQGGALTNWTTIPGKGVYCINIFTDRFCQTFSFSISDSNHFVVNEKSAFLYILICISISTLVRSTQITRNPFLILINKSIENWINEKKIFFFQFLLRFSTYRSWHEYRLLTRFEFVEGNIEYRKKRNNLRYV